MKIINISSEMIFNFFWIPKIDIEQRIFNDNMVLVMSDQFLANNSKTKKYTEHRYSSLQSLKSQFSNKYCLVFVALVVYEL